MGAEVPHGCCRMAAGLGPNAVHNWKEAMNPLAILYDDRFNAAG